MATALRIVLLIFGVLFILCGGCTALIWGVVALSMPGAVAFFALGIAVLVAGVFMLYAATRSKPDQAPPAG